MIINKIGKTLSCLNLALIRFNRKFARGAIFTSKDREYRDYKIGEFTYGTPNIIKYNKNAQLEIGKFCSIAEGVKIFLGGEHHTDSITTYPLKTIFKKNKDDDFSKGNIIIGNDVWIGYGATILSGVTIGNGAVIGAQSVVSKSVEHYSIVAGNPAREIRKRFNKGTVARLLKEKWWDWDTKKIESSLKYLINTPE